MDRSFLCHPEVVAAAKQFVCIRLTSYEDNSEKEFVAKLGGREVSNTAFAILTPEGTAAVRGRGPGRGPRDLFPDASAMAKGMATLAQRFPLKKAEGKPALPVALSAKVGLAIAAADLQPLVVVLAASPKRQEELEARVAPLAWDSSFAGRFAYATTASLKDLPKVQGSTIKEGILIIEPDLFGAGGKVVKEVPVSQLATLALSLQDTLKAHVRINKTRRDLANRGYQEGIYYETGIPVSGRGEAADRERYKKQLELKKKD